MAQEATRGGDMRVHSWYPTYYPAATGGYPKAALPEVGDTAREDADPLYVAALTHA